MMKDVEETGTLITEKQVGHSSDDAEKLRCTKING